MKEIIQSVERGVATMAVAPSLVSFHVRAALMGKDRAVNGSTQALSLVPGIIGQYLRRAFLQQTLAECASSTAIEFGTLFSQAGTRIEANVYIGPRCHIGLAHIERDVLIAAGVHIPSGPHTHGTTPGLPIRDQPGTPRMVRIGAGSWIGSNAVVLADVGRDTIVAAGAVVTQPLPDRVIAAGVPAKIVRRRDEPASVSA